MWLSHHTPRFILAAAVVACLAAGGATAANASASEAIGTAASVPIAAPKSAAAICEKLAARKARAAAHAKSGRTAARSARRVRATVRRRCIARAHRAARRNRARASVAPTQVGGNLVIGIDGGASGWSDSEIAERAQLGAAVTRHEWDPSEPVDAQDDVVLAAAEEIHTRLHALLGGNQLGDPAHYSEWVVAFIRRYGIGGSFWAENPQLDASRYAITSVELGNEPYFGEMSASLYADTVRPALEEIHRLNLPVSVVLPSRVYGTNTTWMDTLYERIPNLNELFSAFADHPYWYGHDPAQVDAAGPFGRIEVLRRRMNERGASTKPIEITEYGESTADCGSECVSEAVQATHLGEMIAAVSTHPEWGVKFLSVYQLRDRGTSSGDRELQFGLLRQDGSPKPAYAIVSGAMQQFHG
jgi:hypothetical protein